MTVAASELVDRLVIRDRNRPRGFDLAPAFDGSPDMTRTIDGASTLTVRVVDADRKIIGSGVLTERLTAIAAGLHWELVATKKSGSRLELTFEDAIVAALRRRTDRLSIPAGTITRREFGMRLAREARVKHAIDDTKRGKVNSELTRSARGEEKENSWDVLGSAAEEVQWRRFSTGKQLVMGSDNWLIGRDARPVKLREHRGAVQDIDWDLDTGKRASKCTVVVDAVLMNAFEPGGVVIVEDQGPADGRWLVQEFARPLASVRGSVTLTRAQHALKEPPPNQADTGEKDFLPGQDGDAAGGGTASNAARERMVKWALAQAGKPYIWGGNGPTGFDCSGLVQEASRAAGRVLTKPSKSQWATCVAQGKTVSVATALQTRGALLFRMSGEPTHVAISLGNGSTIEAMGTAYGVLVAGNAASRGWTGGALWL